MSHVLRQDGPSLDSTWPFQRTLCFEFYWFYCFCAWHDACFTQQESRLTNIKPNVHSCFFCMIWLKWGKHIWQSWPKMSEKIMDLSLQISLVFRKPLQLRKGFKGARATIEICQLAADSFSQGNINRYLWLLIHKKSKSDKHLTLSPPQQSQMLSNAYQKGCSWKRNGKKNIVSKRQMVKVEKARKKQTSLQFPPTSRRASWEGQVRFLINMARFFSRGKHRLHMVSIFLIFCVYIYIIMY